MDPAFASVQAAYGEFNKSLKRHQVISMSLASFRPYPASHDCYCLALVHWEGRVAV